MIESTTIALLARTSGLLDPLRTFIHEQHKPVWGTCAGAILLSSKIVRGSAKKNGQELLGGIDVTIERNGWGAQVESFEAGLEFTEEFERGLLSSNRQGKNAQTRAEFLGVFIRAPVRRCAQYSGAVP